MAQNTGHTYCPDAIGSGSNWNCHLSGELDLCQLEAEMIRVQAQLSRQCEEMRVKINEHKALLSPVRRLPDELLSEIFLHCLPDQQQMTFKFCHDSFRGEEAPLLLGSVCRRWRMVSLSTCKSFGRSFGSTLPREGWGCRRGGEHMVEESQYTAIVCFAFRGL